MHHVFFTQDSMSKLKWWVQDIAIAYNQITENNLDLTLTTDASTKDWGAGRQCVESLYWNHKTLHILGMVLRQAHLAKWLPYSRCPQCWVRETVWWVGFRSVRNYYGNVGPIRYYGNLGPLIIVKFLTMSLALPNVKCLAFLTRD